MPPDTARRVWAGPFHLKPKGNNLMADARVTLNQYAIALCVGLLVGAIYGTLNVRSPAPPVIALIGLLGILLGEQVVPIAKRLVSGEAITVGWLKAVCHPHVLGQLPRNETKATQRDA
jgi:XapX domain-containing protein